MKMQVIAVLIIVSAGLGLLHSADAYDFEDRDGGDKDFTPPVLEADLSGNGSNFLAGEPEIAVNPVHPGNLFIDYTVFPVPTLLTSPNPPHPCGGLVSRNDGLSWQPAFVPLEACSDAIATFGPDGALYAGGIVTTNSSLVPCTTPGSIPFGPVCILVTGYDALLRSTDSGQTWSNPLQVIGSTTIAPFPFAPLSGNPVGTFDRPFVVVDQSTGIVYFSSQNIANHERFVTASNNGGQSFGMIYAVDSPTYPQAPTSASNIVAANGLLAVAYVASQAPGATCPCLIFETSADLGAAFTRHVVPLVNASSALHPFVAANPVGQGRFALTVFDSTGTKNQVYVTAELWPDLAQGQRWSERTPRTRASSPSISYGRLRPARAGVENPPQRWQHRCVVCGALGRDEGRNGLAIQHAPTREQRGLHSAAGGWGTWRRLLLGHC